MADKVLLSIVIVSYNNPGVIDDCLDSIEEHNDLGDALEVIVVEQSKTDELYNHLKEKYPGIRMLRAENRGFGAGNNRGAAEAKGEILFFLNPDTVVTEPMFAHIADRFKADPGLGLLGVRLLNRNGKNCSYNMLFPYGLLPRIKAVLRLKTDRFVEDEMYIEGADLIFRADLFRKIGRFDESIFMYGEEMDLCYRVRKAGYHIAYDKGKLIYHLQGQSTADRYPKVFDKQLDSFIYISRKHGLDYKKYLRKEYRYQKAYKAVMSAAGRKELARRSGELIEVLKRKIENTSQNEP